MQRFLSLVRRRITARSTLWLLLVVGVAAIAVLALKIRRVPQRRGEESAARTHQGDPPRDVTVKVNYQYLIYSEGARSLGLDWEPLVGGRRPLLYVPSD